MNDSLFTFLQTSSVGSFFVKGFGATLAGLFVLFSLILRRQVGLMRKTIIIKDNGLLSIYATAQIVVALVLFGYALVIL